MSDGPRIVAAEHAALRRPPSEIRRGDRRSENRSVARQRRGRDSNPRYLAVHTISSRAPSTTRSPLLVFDYQGSCGERGIRTPGTLAGTPDFESGTFNHSVISPPRVVPPRGGSCQCEFRPDAPSSTGVSLNADAPRSVGPQVPYAPCADMPVGLYAVERRGHTERRLWLHQQRAVNPARAGRQQR